MTSEIAIYTQCSRCVPIMVFQSSRNDATGYPLIILYFGLVCRSRIAGIEMGDIGIHISIPMAIEIVPQFEITSILLKTHIGTVIVTTSILHGNGAAETTTPHLISGLCLNGTITSCTYINHRIDTIFMRCPSHDIDHAPHCIRAIKHRSRSTQHLDTLSHQCLIAVGNRMTENSLILGMTVNEHQQLTSTTCDTAKVNATSSTCRDTIAHHGT